MTDVAKFSLLRQHSRLNKGGCISVVASLFLCRDIQSQTKEVKSLYRWQGLLFSGANKLNEGGYSYDRRTINKQGLQFVIGIPILVHACVAINVIVISARNAPNVHQWVTLVPYVCAAIKINFSLEALAIISWLLSLPSPYHSWLPSSSSL